MCAEDEVPLPYVSMNIENSNIKYRCGGDFFVRIHWMVSMETNAVEHFMLQLIKMFILFIIVFLENYSFICN